MIFILNLPELNIMHKSRYNWEHYNIPSECLAVKVQIWRQWLDKAVLWRRSSHCHKSFVIKCQAWPVNVITTSSEYKGRQKTVTSNKIGRSSFAIFRLTLWAWLGQWWREICLEVGVLRWLTELLSIGSLRPKTVSPSSRSLSAVLRQHTLCPDLI